MYTNSLQNLLIWQVVKHKTKNLFYCILYICMTMVWTVLITTSINYNVSIFVIILDIPCRYQGSVHTSIVSFLNSFTKQWYSTFLQLSYFCISEHFFFWDALSHSSLFIGHFWTTCGVAIDSEQIWACASPWN